MFEQIIFKFLFLWKTMLLEQSDFCTKEVRFHESEVEVTLQTIFPTDLCLAFFFHPGL